MNSLYQRIVTGQVIFGKNSNTYIVLFADVIAALLVLDNFVVLWFAAAEGNATGLARTHHRARTVEVDVL